MPVFCGVIWILLTNSLTCRKAAQGDREDLDTLKQTEKLHQSVQNKHHVLSYSIYFYKDLRVGRITLPQTNPAMMRTDWPPASDGLWDGKRVHFELVSLIRHQGERHVPALKSDFFFSLCDLCDFIKLAYFTQCLQRCALWEKSINYKKKKKKCINFNFRG